MDSQARPEPADKELGQLNGTEQRNQTFFEKHLSHLVTAGIGLIAAIMTLLAAMWGAGIGAEAAVTAATMQNEAEDVRRTQDRRDIAYKEYLNAANNFFYEWVALPTPGSADTDATDEAGNLGRFVTARTAYQAQVNEVFVYGSEAAWTAHREVAAALPAAIAGARFPKPYTEPDNNAFRDAFNNFLNVRCREATALARSTCSGAFNVRP